MNLAEQIVADYKYALSMTDEFGIEVTYTRYSDKTTVLANAVIERSDFRQFNGDIVADIATVFIDLEFRPEVYDILFFDHEEWKVMNFSYVSGGYRLDVTKDKVPTQRTSGSRFR